MNFKDLDWFVETRTTGEGNLVKYRFLKCAD